MPQLGDSVFSFLFLEAPVSVLVLNLHRVAPQERPRFAGLSRYSKRRLVTKPISGESAFIFIFKRFTFWVPFGPFPPWLSLSRGHMEAPARNPLVSLSLDTPHATQWPARSWGPR